MAAPSLPPLPVLSEAQRNTLDLFNDWASPALAHLGVMKAVLEGHLQVDIGPLLKHFNLSGQPRGAEQLRAVKLAQEILLRKAFRDSVAPHRYMDTVDHGTVKEVIRAQVQGRSIGLLDEWLGALATMPSTDEVRQFPMTVLARILAIPPAQGLGRATLKALNWYGALPDEQDSPLARAKLIALVMCKHLRQHLAGFDLDEPKWVGHSYASLHQALETHLLRSGAVAHEQNAVLGAFLLRRYLPADFSVLDVPPELGYRNSVYWVKFKQAVGLAELIRPGDAQRMTFAQLLAYPDQVAKALGEAGNTLLAGTLLLPLLSWAAATGTVPGTDNLSKEQLQAAIKAFNQEEDSLIDAVAALAAPMPQRLEMADAELEAIRVPPYTDFQYNGKGRRVAARDLAAMGYLGRDPAWKPALVIDHGGDLQQPWLPGDYGRSPDVLALFETAHGEWIKRCKGGYALLVRTLIAQLPSADRVAFEQGTVRLYSVGHLPHGRWERYSYTQPSDAIIGRQGFIARVTWKTQVWHYQIIPAAQYIAELPGLTFTPGGLVLESYDPRYRNDIGNYPEVNRQRIPEHAMKYRRAQQLPLDFAAFYSGTPPRAGVHMELVLQPIDISTAVESVAPPLRIQHLAYWVSHDFLHQPDKVLHAQAKGQTVLEQPDPLIAQLKAIIPFWGSSEELDKAIQGKSAVNTLLAALGVLFDAFTVLVPAARVARLAKVGSAAARTGARTGLQRLAAAARVVGSAALEQVTLLPDAARLARYVTGVGVEGLRLLVKRGRANLGKTRVFERGLLTLDAASASAWHRGGRAPGEQLRNIGHDRHVLVTIKRRPPDHLAAHFLLEPAGRQAFGPKLPRRNDAGDLQWQGHADIPGQAVTGGWHFADETPDLSKRWIYQGDDVYLQVDDAYYRKLTLPDGRVVLRRDPQAPRHDRLATLHLPTCRTRRGLIIQGCNPRRAVTEQFSGKAPATHEAGRQVVPWFTDLAITLDPATDQLFHNQRAWKLSNGKLVAATNSASPAKHYRQSVEAQVLGGNELFKQIRVDGGIYPGFADSRTLGAVVARRRNSEATVLVARLDDKAYYRGDYVAGSATLKLQRMQVNLADLPPRIPSEDEYLALIYLGSWDANAYLHKVPKEKLAADLKLIHEEIAAGRHHDVSRLLGGPFDLGTTQEEAVLFCKYTQNQVLIKARKAGLAWRPLDQDTPVEARQRIAGTLNRLLCNETFDAENLLDHALLKAKTLAPRNLAYAHLTFKDKTRAPAVYFGLSGYRNPANHLPLSELVTHPSSKGAQDLRKAGWTVEADIAQAPDGVRYINSQPIRGQGIGNVLFLPDLAPLSISAPGNPRMLDTERGIMVRIKADGITAELVDAMEVFTVLPTCQSCTVGLTAFGRELGAGKFVLHEGLPAARRN